MDKIITNTKLKSRYKAVPSKSVAHRALICAAFSEMPTRIVISQYGEDVERTVQGLNTIGAKVEKTANGFFVRPVEREFIEIDDGTDEGKGIHKLKFFEDGHKALIDCGDSATTYRFFDEICKELGIDYELTGSPRLMERIASGIPTSQNYSGQIIALGLRPYGIEIEIDGDKPFPSKPYVELTIQVMCDFGCSGYESPGCYEVEGDWTQASYFLAMGDTSVKGLNLDSAQGDKKIADILRGFGAVVFSSKDTVSVRRPEVLKSPGKIDLMENPDLLPTVAVIAAVAEGTTEIENVGHLRFKESDRVKATCEMINDAGGTAIPTKNSIIIEGAGKKLKGGHINTYRDHRIAMAACVLAYNAEGPVVISDAECVSKSWPGFWEAVEK